MKINLLLIIALLLIIPIVTPCEVDYHKNKNVTIFDAIETNGENASCNLTLYYDNTFNQSGWMVQNGLAYEYEAGVLSNGTYIANIECNASNNLFLGECKFIVEATEDMAGVAIMMFVLTIGVGLFILPFFKRFNEVEWVNLIFKRGCWILSIFLMSSNAAVVVEIASAAGLDVKRTMFDIYMTWLGWAGVILMGFMVWRTLVDVLASYKKQKQVERVGY